MKIPNIRDLLVYLRITSFIGTSPDAVHWYGELIAYEMGDPAELRKTLSRHAADKLNQLHGSGSLYKEGHQFYGFDSKEEVIDHAKKFWKEYFPDGFALILGNPATADPQLVLEAPESFKDTVNEMYERLEEIPWVGQGMYRREDEAAADAIYYEYRAYLNRLNDELQAHFEEVLADAP